MQSETAAFEVAADGHSQARTAFPPLHGQSDAGFQFH